MMLLARPEVLDYDRIESEDQKTIKIYEVLENGVERRGDF